LAGVERLSGVINSVPEEILSMDERPAGSRREAATDPTRGELVEVLFRHHYADMLRLAVVMLGSREAAEDAVQDAFVALHRNWQSLRDPASAEAYLRIAVLNRCRSWIRRQVAQRAPRPLMLVREHQESSEDTTVGRDEVGSLVALMRGLARRQREVLACRFVLEMSIEETAQLLEISQGAVKAHTHRGLHSLQQRMGVAR
jgi:RNA polymerase sigma factor (sigma-70 family)